MLICPGVTDHFPDRWVSKMQALLGDAHVDTTARYIHLAPAHVKAEFDAARDRIRSQQ
jgi:site-specific recombinase XerC